MGESMGSIDQEWSHDVPTALAPASRQQQQQQQVSACDQCHRRKLRCSREKPACGRCHFSGRQCTYSLCRPAGRPRRSISGKAESSSSAGEPLPSQFNDKMAEAISFSDTSVVPLLAEYPFPGSLFDMSSFPSTMSAVPFPDSLPSYHDGFSGTTTLCTSPTVISPGSGMSGHGALSTTLPSLPGQPELAFLTDGGRPEPAGRAGSVPHVYPQPPSPSTSASTGSEGAVCRCTEALLRSASDLEAAAAAAAADPTSAPPRPSVLELANVGFEAMVMCKQKHDGLQHLMLLVVICQLENYTGIACPPPQQRQQQTGGGGAASPDRRSSLPLSPKTHGLVSPSPAGFERLDAPPDAKASPQPDALASFPRGLVLRSYLLLAALSSEVLTREGNQSCFPEVPLDIPRSRVDWMKVVFRTRLGLDV